MTVQDIIDNKSDHSIKKHCLYEIWDGKTCLYIGKTEKRTIQQRLQDHLGKGFIPATTAFDRYIKKSDQKVMQWTVVLYEKDDWNKIFDSEKLPHRYALNRAESALIRLRKPKMNRQSHPDYKKELPWLKK